MICRDSNSKYGQHYDHTQQKGILAELKAQQKATELGFIVSRPISDAMYDYIFDSGDALYKVQVKYCDSKTLYDGAVTLDLRKKNLYGERELRYKTGDIDVIILYIPEIDILCWVPFSVLAGKTSFAIRYFSSAPEYKAAATTTNIVEDYIWK